MTTKDKSEKKDNPPCSGGHPVVQVYNSLSGKINELTNKATGDLKSIPVFDIEEPQARFKGIIILFLCRGIEILQTIEAILSVDLTLYRMAEVIIRPLVEMYVDARYMKTDPVTLSERYERYQVIRQHNYRKEGQDRI